LADVPHTSGTAFLTPAANEKFLNLPLKANVLGFSKMEAASTELAGTVIQLKNNLFHSGQQRN
jgi:hypothetical protein